MKEDTNLPTRQVSLFFLKWFVLNDIWLQMTLIKTKSLDMSTILEYLKIVKIKCQAKTIMPHRGGAFDSAFLSWVI